MGSERGSAALFVIGALAISALAGIGVYYVIKESRAAEATAAPKAAPPPAAKVAPAPPAEPTLPPEPPAAPPVPVDIAAVDAVDPDVDGGPPATNAPIFGTPGVEGQLDKEAIAAAVKPITSKLQRCFEKRLAAGARIGGTLRVALEVNRRGGVDRATSAGVDDELGTCVASVLGAVRFAKTRDGGTARIVYPIAFHSANGDDAGDVRAGPPPVREDVPEVPEEPSRSELIAAFQMLRRPVSHCAQVSGYAGTLKVRLQILPTGKAAAVTVSGVEPELGTCVARAVKAQTFPQSVNGVSVNYPFVIHPE